MKLNYLPSWILSLTLFCCLSSLLWSLSLPLYIDLLMLIGVFCTTLRAQLPSQIILFVSLIISVAGIEFVARRTFVAKPPFFREHEKYAEGKHYRPDVSDVIQMSYGDIASTDSTLPSSIMEPREVHFKSDHLGFRNSHEYLPGDFILAGDSFLVGNGTDWADTLPAILETRFQFPVYSIAFPGDPSEYVERANWFMQNVDSQVNFAFFLYEGNDFGNGDSDSITDSSKYWSTLLSPQLAELLNNYDKWRGVLLKSLVPQLQYPLFLFNRSRLLERQFLFQRERSGIHMAKVGPKFMAAHSFQSAVALVKERSFGLPPPESVKERIACAFFIPTKIRVYNKYFGYEMPEPSASFVALQSYFKGSNTTVIDLTSDLRAEAERLLLLGQYVYWRDDSHWNGNGMRAVSNTVYACLNSAKQKSNFSR